MATYPELTWFCAGAAWMAVVWIIGLYLRKDHDEAVRVERRLGPK